MDKPVTALLVDFTNGNAAALDELLPMVYQELRAMAGLIFRGQRSDNTLQPTVLVHEVYLRLVDRDSAGWKGRAHFMATAAKAMRQVLIDHHRRRKADKRGAGWRAMRLSVAQLEARNDEVDVVDLDDALKRLAELDERQGRLVEMRIFGGLEIEEIAEVLGVSRRTVQYDWRHARAWLRKTLFPPDET